MVYLFFPWASSPREKNIEFFADRSCSETKQKTLEEIAAAFGDKVVLLTDDDVAVEEAIFKDKGGAQHLELEKAAV